MEYRESLRRQLASAGPKASKMLTKEKPLDVEVMIGALKAVTFLDPITVGPELSELHLVIHDLCSRDEGMEVLAEVGAALTIEPLPLHDDVVERDYTHPMYPHLPGSECHQTLIDNLQQLLCLFGLEAVMPQPYRYKIGRMRSQVSDTIREERKRHKELFTLLGYLDCQLGLDEVTPLGVFFYDYRRAQKGWEIELITEAMERLRNE